MTRLAVLIATALLATGCTATQATTTDTSITALLAGVRIIPGRPNPAGYDRECGKQHACSFGAAWTDKHSGKGGRNGCDSRNDVLGKQMTGVTYKARTDNCVVLTGSLADPYTGRTIAFRKTNPLAVQIDHLYPLSRAWDMGANEWSQQKRIDFANDQERNLLAVDGAANQSKGDSGPGEWLPINKSYRCAYVAAFLDVARHWELPITRDDADSIKHTAKGCTGGTK